MRSFGAKSWTPFAVTDKASPVIKSSSTTLVQTEKVNASEPSFATSSDEDYYTPLRLALPRPEFDTPSLKADSPRQDQNQPGIVLSTPSEDENQTIVLHESKTPPQELDIGKSSVSPQDMARETARESGSFSPHSNNSLNDLIQSMSDTPVEDHSGLFRATLPIRLKGPRIEVSESSIDAPLDQYAVSDVSNTPSANLDLEKVSRSLSKLAVSNESFDGPALDLEGMKNIDFEPSASAYPPIPEGSESSRDALSTQPTPNAPEVEEEAPMTPMTVIADRSSTASDLPMKNPADAAMPPLLPEAAIPVGDVVSTGALDASTTQSPIKQKGKAKGARLLQKARHILLRKHILRLLLGRKVAEPTSELLKQASRGGPVVPVVDADPVKDTPVGYPV